MLCFMLLLLLLEEFNGEVGEQCGLTASLPSWAWVN